MNEMHTREATIQDIPQIQVIRRAVKENVLSDPMRVTDADCEQYITVRGKGWVCEIQHDIIGFAIVDVKENNVWALFVHPDHEQKGAGKKLHDIMLEWYFNQSQNSLWLSTSPGTRAEKFYILQGWQPAGIYGNNEVKFEMFFERWMNIK